MPLFLHEKAMAEVDKKKLKGESVVTGTLHKSSGSAVSNVEVYNRQLSPDGTGEWFVAILDHQKYTASCCQYIENMFHDQGCICYVPCKQEERRYANRTRHIVTRYIIPRYIFVSGISEVQAYNFVRDWPHVDFFMPDRAMDRVNGRVVLAKIQHKELVMFQDTINKVESADDIIFTEKKLVFDQQIEVVKGELKGLEGGYYKDGGDDYLVFMLGRLGNIKVRVSAKDCKLKKKKP